MVERQYRKHGLNTARTAKQVAGHGFGGIHHHFVSVVAQSRLNGLGFVDITQRR
jgi:hypothetical protein